MWRAPAIKMENRRVLSVMYRAQGRASTMSCNKLYTVLSRLAQIVQTVDLPRSYKDSAFTFITVYRSSRCVDSKDMNPSGHHMSRLSAACRQSGLDIVNTFC